MYRVSIVLIAALSVMSQPSTAQVLYGGGIEAGSAQTKVSKDKEVDKKGTTYAVHAGLSIFPTENSVLTPTLGIQTFSVEGKANKRTQRIKASLGLFQLDYAFMLDGFEPGLLLRINYGKTATLLAADKEETQPTTSVGPKFGYRWRVGASDIVTYVAATFDVMGSDQKKQSILLGASYWIGRDDPRDDPSAWNSDPVATADLPPESSDAAPEVAPPAEPAAPVEAPELLAVEEVAEEVKAPVDLRIKPDVFQFDVNSDKLTPASAIKAKKLAEALGTMTVAWSAIHVGGHSDANSKNPTRNLEVSELRAAAVRDLLMASGVNSESIVIKGYSASEPLPEVDAMSPVNRRAELLFIGVTEPEKLTEALKEFVFVEN